MGLLDSVGNFLGLTGKTTDAAQVGVTGAASDEEKRKAMKEAAHGSIAQVMRNEAAGKNDAIRQDLEQKARQPFELQNLDQMRQQRADLFAERLAQPGVQFDAASQAEMRGRQLGLADQLAARARGDAPSAAELMLQASRDGNLRQARALAASQEGMAPGLAQQAALRSAADANLQVGQQMGALRAQEQAQAEQALAGVLQGARGADIGVAGQQAQVGLQNTAQRDAAIQNFLNQGLTLEQANLAANMQLAGLQQNAELANMAAQNQMIAGNQAAKNQLFGGLLAAGGQLGSAAITGGK